MLFEVAPAARTAPVVHVTISALLTSGSAQHVVVQAQLRPRGSDADDQQVHDDPDLRLPGHDGEETVHRLGEGGKEESDDDVC